MSAPSQSSTPREWVHLAPNPKSAYKQLFIKGTRIRAEVVYRLSVGREPMTAEEIAADYGLPLEAVKEAIVYGASNPPEIEADRRGEERVMEATGMNDSDYKRGGKYKVLSPQERAELGL
ncbi:MAG TPA: DUF433 domain-containing protein [Gemmataceae bacterium]